MGKRSGWLRLAAAVISGLMVAVLFPPFKAAGLVWIAFVPLLWALWTLEEKRAGWKGFGLGFLAGAVSCLIQFNWLSTVSSVAAVLLPLYLACYWGIFGAFSAKFANPWRGQNHLAAAFANASAWAGLELLRGWMFTGFGWNGLGVAFHETPLVAQGADLLGVAGLSFAVVFFQSLLLSTDFKRPAGYVAPVLAVALPFAYGAFRMAENHGAAKRLKALLVQINIPQDAGLQLWTALDVHTAYEDETRKALAALEMPDGSVGKWPDWVVWPETALTGRIFNAGNNVWGTSQENINSVAQVRDAAWPFHLIYGVNEVESELQGENLVAKPDARLYNSIAVMSPDDVLQTFRKRHLVVFGETIPFVDSIPLFKAIYEQQAGAKYVGSFSAGESLDPLPIVTNGTSIGAIPSVCFEDTVPRLTRKFVRSGPQLILNVTNDGWFKTSPAAGQHFANARFRAIELRRPMIRCANSGVSAAIDSKGSTAHPDTGATQILVDGKGSHFTRGSLLVELDVPLDPPFSLYARIGDWGLIALSICGVSIGCRGVKRPSTRLFPLR